MSTMTILARSMIGLLLSGSLLGAPSLLPTLNPGAEPTPEVVAVDPDPAPALPDEVGGEGQDGAGENLIPTNDAPQSEGDAENTPELKEEEPLEEPEVAALEVQEEETQLFARGQYSPKALSGHTRLGGASRYDTATQISRHVTAQSQRSDLVFVATGTDFPDALSVGALAAYVGAPLLLTTPEGLPANVRAEIVALQPKHIVIAGGQGAVSAQVEGQLKSIAEVTRIWGANRYETSAKIAGFFPKGSPGFVTTGQNFPDATVAAGPAAKQGGPVILTPMGTLHPEASGALVDLAPSEIYVIGGTWGPEARSQMAGAGGRGPTIISGTNRFSTSAKVAQHFWGTASSTLVYARGDAFPDALSGVAVTRAHDAPLLLTRNQCRPDELTAVTGNQSAVVILGGTGAVADSGTSSSCSEIVAFNDGVYTFPQMTWELQETNFYCGPAAGKMALKGMGRTTSASGLPLSQKLLASYGYMRTDALGYTQGETNDLIRGLNAYLGGNVYSSHRAPSGAALRAAVLDSFTKTKRPVLLGAGEVMGGPRYNNHPTHKVIGHYVVIYGFDTKTNELLIMDSAAGLNHNYARSAPIFRYDVNLFAQRFLNNFWHHGFYY